MITNLIFKVFEAIQDNSAIVSLFIALMAIIISARSSAKSAKLTRELAEESSRPYLVLTLNSYGRNAIKMLCLKNYGKTAAIIDSITFDPPLLTYEKNLAFDSHSGRSLAPNQRVFTEFANNVENKSAHKARILYRNSLGKIFKDEFDINFCFFKSDLTVHITNKDPIKSIDYTLQDILKELL